MKLMLNKSILVIDDDHDMLNLFHHYLKEVVSDIDLSFEPETTMERLRFKKYDLVITDILMPIINCIDLTKQIKQEYKTLPILVCSEGGITDARDIVAGIVMNKAISYGAIYALKKPFKKGALVTTVESILNGNVETVQEDQEKDS